MIQRRLLMLAAAAATVPMRAARAAGGEIVLGQSGVLSGPLGVPIKALLAGAQLAFAQANQAGGIHGRRVRVLSLDDELKPDKAVANHKRLVEDEQVLACFASVGSATTAASAPVFEAANTPLVGAYAVGDSARRKLLASAYFVRASAGREAQALVQHLATLGIQRLAVAHLDNPGGVEAATLLRAALAEQKVELVAALPVKLDGSNAADAGRELARLAPQAVLMYLAGDMPAKLMKSHWAADGTSSFYGMSIVPGEVVSRALGAEMKSLVVSQVMPYPWSPVEPTAREFRRLADAGGVPIGYLPFEGYVNALVMLEALRRTGPDPTRARLHATLRAMKLRLAGVDLDFTDRQALSGSRLVDMVLVSKDGRFTR